MHLRKYALVGVNYSFWFTSCATCVKDKSRVITCIIKLQKIEINRSKQKKYLELLVIAQGSMEVIVET